MDKYLFLFYDYESHLCSWECFDPKEPVSDAMAVQQAFNMLICDDLYCSVVISRMAAILNPLMVGF